MILYLDTSALVKLYAEEPGREEVQSAVKDARVVAVSEIGYVEACSALARKEREGFFSADEHDATVEQLQRDYREVYLSRPVTGDLIARAGALAREHALRAYDAVHLATALILREEAQETLESEERPREEVQGLGIELLTYDSSLAKAAREEDLAYEPDASPLPGDRQERELPT